jgi:cation:H+ antiporter
MEKFLADLQSDPHVALLHLVDDWHSAALLLIMAASMFVLGKGADWLVEDAVTLSLRWGMPRVVVGATIVSLGTTTPEAVVSVMSAVQGRPEMALGNAVGSIICDTGLILGIACLIAPLPIDRRIANRQGWVQFGCGFLLVGLCVPWTNLAATFKTGGTLPQAAGFLLVALLVIYLIWSVRMAKSAPTEKAEGEHADEHADANIWRAVGRMALAIALVVLSAEVLIATAETLAVRFGVPREIVAATLVAFGTSLPELVIVVTATLKGHGELAIGNVIGADILNVLFVAGVAASVTPKGLAANPNFFYMQFPAMLFILTVFRIGIWTARDGKLRRPFGVILLGTYVVVTIISFVVAGPAAAHGP